MWEPIRTLSVLEKEKKKKKRQKKGQRRSNGCGGIAVNTVERPLMLRRATPDAMGARTRLLINGSLLFSVTYDPFCSHTTRAGTPENCAIFSHLL